MKSNHKTKSEKEQRLLTYLSKKDKSEFEKLLEEAEKKKVPVRQCKLKILLANLAQDKKQHYAYTKKIRKEKRFYE